jgi:hypothetical protein
LTGQISFRSAKVGETFKLSGELSINAMSVLAEIHDSTRIRHRANWPQAPPNSPIRQVFFE